MRKYLPHVLEQLTAPPIKIETNLFSLSRLISKRKTVKECKKLWGYHSEDEIDREIAGVYYGVREAVMAGNSAMALRYLSIELYQEYASNPQALQLEEGVSNVSILNGGRSKDESSGREWLHLQVVIKHFNLQHLYQLERRIYNQNYHSPNLFPRKWCFSSFPKAP